MKIESILTEFATATDLPEAAILESVARKDESVPVFLSLLERAYDLDQVSRDEENSLFLIVHVLAELGERRAYRPLIKFLSGNQRRVDRLLGEAVTETLPQILISTFDGDVAPLLAVMDNADLDAFVRDAAFRAWTYFVIEGVVDREDARRYLQSCPDSLRPPRESQVWVSWADAITRIPFADLMPLVQSAYEDGRISNDFMDLEEFSEELESMVNPISRQDSLRLAGLHPFASTVERLSDWRLNRQEDDDPAFDWDDAFDEDLPGLADDGEFDLPPLAGDPVINPFRHVGRNDPCPCGSGKKFKKCCLPMVQA